ncbi:MAG: thioredoxin family protein [Sulfuricurvum sp.]|uniref:thioredoxin family protein n=1 Tax=Sulfuricurvum sp. TaxID=2025608 RepID=UPI002604562A|nr:thioredoxin family protein [Sulfuricurvum sp.]MDD5159708.1 thioredoxin family protein [Sulfuricurvum sp.]
MNKIVFILLLSVFSLFGAGIKWEKDYSTAIAKAKAVNKPLMFIVSNHGCHFCVQFENSTLKDTKVVQKLNNDYVSAIVYIDENPIFPHQLYVPGTPGTWFLKSNGEPMFEPIMGAVGSEDFLKALDIVKEDYKKSSTKK